MREHGYISYFRTNLHSLESGQRKRNLYQSDYVGDWPDPDLIRVDDKFYFVSTSMHYVPGCLIAVSEDLVNWEMAGYAVERYDEDPRYDMQEATCI